MTELMKRYEAETGGDAIILYEEHISDDFARWVNKEYLELQDENAKLKAQLRWRPVREKPEKKDYYLVKTLNFVFKAYFDGESFRKVVDQKLVELIATHWLPIPPAPEGE